MCCLTFLHCSNEHIQYTISCCGTPGSLPISVALYNGTCDQRRVRTAGCGQEQQYVVWLDYLVHLLLGGLAKGRGQMVVED